MLAHIVSQTRQNVEFLMAHNEISRDAGQDILAKLPTASDITARELSDQTRRMTIQPSSAPTSSYDPPAAPPPGPPVRRAPPAQPQPSLQRAKALWTYNENGSVCTFPSFLTNSTLMSVLQEPNDLSFRAGDIIEVVAETNTDWWTGRLNGKQGLFPSNYVEKIPGSPPSYPPPSDTRGASPAPLAPYNSGPPAPYQPVYNGPPQGGYQAQSPQPYNPYLGPPSQPPQQVVAQQAPPSEPAKSNRFGGMGRLVRH